MSPATPINLKKQDNSPAALAQFVDYAISVADGFEWWWRSNGPEHVRHAERPYEGVTVLEIGPGETLGSAVLLACAGATVSVADRFLAPWDPEFHDPFYRALLAKVASRGEAYTAPIRRLLDTGTFGRDVVRCHPFAAEELWKIRDRFDVVLSNAVLEHVQSIETTAENLAAVTAAGGYGFHQVDFRDHRDFTRPLEYLTMSRTDFERIRQRTFCEGGCQWRVSTFGAAFEAAGFSHTVSPNLMADPQYVRDVRPRLHPEFAGHTDEDLAAASAFFVLRRTR
jgi:hypothetical protein